MIQYFDIHDINKAPSAFNLEKLLWLNQHYLKTGDPALLTKHLHWHMRQLGVETDDGPALEVVLLAQRDRAKTLKEMAEKSLFFYREIDIDPEAREKHLTSEA